MRLVITNHGTVEFQKEFGNFEELKSYLVNNGDIFSWIADEEPGVELPEFEDVESVREIESIFEEYNLGWWTVTIEENMAFVNYLREKLNTRMFKVLTSDLDLNDETLKNRVFDLMMDHNIKVTSDPEVVSESDDLITYRDYYEFKSSLTSNGNPFTVDFEWTERLNKDNQAWEVESIKLLGW